MDIVVTYCRENIARLDGQKYQYISVLLLVRRKSRNSCWLFTPHVRYIHIIHQPIQTSKYPECN